MKGFIVETPYFDVYENMACDEVMCETMPCNYILRFYKWKREGITFGFSQRYNSVIATIDDKRKTYDITRRPTGGGIVIHENDLTFSLIFYSPEEFNPTNTYHMLHSSIYSEYIRNGFSVSILNYKAQYDVNNPTMECFKKPVDMDIMVNDKKILGGALRKFSDYMLYQASLQFDNARNNELHMRLIKSAFEKVFNIDFEPFIIDKYFLEKINKKKTEKYMTKEWIERI